MAPGCRLRATLGPPHLILAAMLVLFACGPQNDDHTTTGPWTLHGNGMASVVNFSGPAAFNTVATRHTAALTLSLTEDQSVCTVSDGCSGGGCQTNQRTLSIDLVSVTCDRADCTATVQPAASGALPTITVTSQAPGPAIVAVVVQVHDTGEQYADRYTVQFADIEELAINRNQPGMWGGTYGMLPGARPVWCVAAVATVDSEERALLVEPNAIQVSIAGAGAAIVSREEPSFNGGSPRLYWQTCIDFEALQPSSPVFSAQLDSFSRQVPFRIIDPADVASIEIRAHALNTSRAVETEPVGDGPALSEIQACAHRMSGPYAEILVLSDGGHALGGAGALSVEPAAIASVELDGVHGTDEQLAAWGVFYVTSAAEPGSATLHGQVGRAALSLPVVMNACELDGAVVRDAADAGDAAEAGDAADAPTLDVDAPSDGPASSDGGDASPADDGPSDAGEALDADH
jgi:hypothetical protein